MGPWVGQTIPWSPDATVCCRCTEQLCGRVEGPSCYTGNGLGILETMILSSVGSRETGGFCLWLCACNRIQKWGQVRSERTSGGEQEDKRKGLPQLSTCPEPTNRPYKDNVSLCQYKVKGQVHPHSFSLMKAAHFSPPAALPDEVLWGADSCKRTQTAELTYGHWLYLKVHYTAHSRMKMESKDFNTLK